MKALEALMFLTEKQNCDIEGRMCADGWKQWSEYEKIETTSPTVVSDSVMLTAAINAAEWRDVAVMDLPGAFLLQIWMI